eukprot:g27765.t1
MVDAVRALLLHASLTTSSIEDLKAKTDNPIEALRSSFMASRAQILPLVDPFFVSLHENLEAVAQELELSGRVLRRLSVADVELSTQSELARWRHLQQNKLKAKLDALAEARLRLNQEAAKSNAHPGTARRVKRKRRVSWPALPSCCCSCLAAVSPVGTPDLRTATRRWRDVDEGHQILLHKLQEGGIRGAGRQLQNLSRLLDPVSAEGKVLAAYRWFYSVGVASHNVQLLEAAWNEVVALETETPLSLSTRSGEFSFASDKKEKGRKSSSERAFRKEWLVAEALLYVVRERQEVLHQNIPVPFFLQEKAAQLCRRILSWTKASLHEPALLTTALAAAASSSSNSSSSTTQETTSASSNELLPSSAPILAEDFSNPDAPGRGRKAGSSTPRLVSPRNPHYIQYLCKRLQLSARQASVYALAVRLLLLRTTQEVLSLDGGASVHSDSSTAVFSSTSLRKDTGLGQSLSKATSSQSSNWLLRETLTGTAKNQFKQWRLEQQRLERARCPHNSLDAAPSSPSSSSSPELPASPPSTPPPLPSEELCTLAAQQSLLTQVLEAVGAAPLLESILCREPLLKHVPVASVLANAYLDDAWACVQLFLRRTASKAQADAFFVYHARLFELHSSLQRLFRATALLSPTRDVSPASWEGAFCPFIDQWLGDVPVHLPALLLPLLAADASSPNTNAESETAVQQPVEESAIAVQPAEAAQPQAGADKAADELSQALIAVGCSVSMEQALRVLCGWLVTFHHMPYSPSQACRWASALTEVLGTCFHATSAQLIHQLCVHLTDWDAKLADASTMSSLSSDHLRSLTSPATISRIQDMFYLLARVTALLQYTPIRRLLCASLPVTADTAHAVSRELADSPSEQAAAEVGGLLSLVKASPDPQTSVWFDSRNGATWPALSRRLERQVAAQAAAQAASSEPCNEQQVAFSAQQQAQPATTAPTLKQQEVAQQANEEDMAGQAKEGNHSSSFYDAQQAEQLANGRNGCSSHERRESLWEKPGGLDQTQLNQAGAPDFWQTLADLPEAGRLQEIGMKELEKLCRLFARGLARLVQPALLAPDTGLLWVVPSQRLGAEEMLAQLEAPWQALRGALQVLQAYCEPALQNELQYFVVRRLLKNLEQEVLVRHLCSTQLERVLDLAQHILVKVISQEAYRDRLAVKGQELDRLQKIVAFLLLPTENLLTAAKETMSNDDSCVFLPSSHGMSGPAAEKARLASPPYLTKEHVIERLNTHLYSASNLSS